MEYTQHDPGNSEPDGKKIRRAEERAEKALKSTASKESAKRSTSDRMMMEKVCLTTLPMLLSVKFVPKSLYSRVRTLSLKM